MSLLQVPTHSEEVHQVSQQTPSGVGAAFCSSKSMTTSCCVLRDSLHYAEVSASVLESVSVDRKVREQKTALLAHAHQFCDLSGEKVGCFVELF